ncbi:hypothetical protein KOW79_000107, partial [Hemibagrus wyckioides]
MHEFTNRVEYVKQDRNCTLKMNQLRKKDSGEYRLRVVYTSNRISGRPGVVLNVTDLQVRLSHYAGSSEERTTVTLSCITSCTLSNSPTYLWYKNGQPVTDKLTKHNKLYLFFSEDAGNYSCAVKGREDLRSPEQTQSPAAETLLTTGQNYSISYISSQHSGLYYCTAHNQLGNHTSTPTHLDVAVVLPSGDTVEGDSVTLSCSSDANPPVSNYTWFKQSAAADTLLTTGQNYSISYISSQDSGLYYCTAVVYIESNNVSLLQS